MSPAWALLSRDLKLATRIGGGAMMGVVFYLVVITVFPFAIGPDQNLLGRIAPAILWLGALLATLLGLDRLFQADFEDGSLDLIHISGRSLEGVVLIKILAHWLTTGLPLVVAATALGLLVNLPVQGFWAVSLTLLVGTPALTALGAIGAALTVSLRRGGLLIPILILPLSVPVVIFGVGAANAVIIGPTPFFVPFLLLVASCLVALVLGVVGGAAALRANLE